MKLTREEREVLGRLKRASWEAMMLHHKMLTGTGAASDVAAHAEALDRCSDLVRECGALNVGSLAARTVRAVERCFGVDQVND